MVELENLHLKRLGPLRNEKTPTQTSIGSLGNCLSSSSSTSMSSISSSSSLFSPEDVASSIICCNFFRWSTRSCRLWSMSRLTLSPESPEGQYQDHHGVTEGEGESHYHHLFPSPKCRSLFPNPPGSRLVLLYLLLAQRLPSTPRICFPNPAMLPVQGVVRTKLDISGN